MAKTLMVLALVAGGGLWFFGWPESEPAVAGGRMVVLDPASVGVQARLDAEAGGGNRPGGPNNAPSRRGSPDAGKPSAPGGRKNRGRQSPVSRPVPAPAEAAGSRRPGPSTTGEAAEDRGETTLKAAHPVEPSVAERAARVEALLVRAADLEAAGDPTGASAVLRQGMAGSTSPVEVARLGFFLAGLSDSPAESRRLVTNALRRGVVRDAEYELAGGLLRELNRSTGSSLLGLLRLEEYEVQPNDSLWELCNRTFPREFDVSPEVGLIQLLNGMAGTGLKVGQKLVVPLETLSVVVDRRNHGIVAYLGDVALVSYRVGLGKEGRTPSGTFVIEVKLTEPTWYRDGKAIPFGNPDNILGTRWMGFENNPGAMGYGIHGTAHPDSVGGDESMGCVRMRNEEVEELFDLLARGTTVQIP